MRRFILPFVLFICFFIISFITYKQLFSHGFVFEEWQNYGEIQVLNSVIPANFQLSPVDILLGRRRIIGTLLSNYIMLHFGNNAFPYALVSIVGQTINAFILYYISKRIFRKKTIAISIAMLFITIPISYEALAYFATSLQTIFSVSFYLLSFSCLLIFVDIKKEIYIFLSFLLLYISILFKESTVFFVPILFLTAFYMVVPPKKRVLYLSIIIFLIVSVGIIGAVKYSQSYHALYGLHQFSPITTIVNMGIYPVITISHFIIPERFIIKLGTYYVNNHYPFLGWISPDIYHFIYSSFAADIISLFVGIFIWIVVSYSFIFSKRKKMFIFLLLLYFVSFIPIALAQQQRSTGFLERRYYYPVDAAFVLLIFFCFESCYKKLLTIVKKRYIKITVTTLLVCLLLFIYLKNIAVVHGELADQVATSERIRTLVSQIHIAHPVIPKNPIFYIEQGQDLFPNYGTGYMLGLIYAGSHNVPEALLLSDNVNSPLYYAKEIWKKDFEGYLVDKNEAIGFFYNKKSLKSFMDKNKNLKDQLVGYRLSEGTIHGLSHDQVMSVVEQKE